MTQKTKRALVPELRFPEFRDAGEWEDHQLSDISDRVIEKVGEKTLVTVSITAGTGFVSQEEKFHRNIAGEQYKNYIVLNEGDYSYNKGNSKRYPQGCIYKLKEFEQAAVPNAFISFRFREGFIGDFYQGYFEQNSHGPQLARFITSGARSDGLLNISPIDFFSIRLPTPSAIAEQQKIADCLSSIDELITMEARKIDALKAHKKGLMQQLFPAEGETLPKLRFPEFQHAGEWEEKQVEDFFLVCSSKRVLQEDWTDCGVPFYRTRELVSLNKSEPFSSEIFISEELFSEVSQKYGSPVAGDFLVSGVGTLGISYQVQSSDRFYFKDGNVLWFKSKGKLASNFFKYQLQSDAIQDQIRGQSAISTVGTYTIQNAKKTKFSLPTCIEEQQKIADCLSAIDELVTMEARKLDALKAHKKGLLQQLFPAIDEVRK